MNVCVAATECLKIPQFAGKKDLGERYTDSSTNARESTEVQNKAQRNQLVFDGML
jgi:hypothetical protein